VREEEAGRGGGARGARGAGCGSKKQTEEDYCMEAASHTLRSPTVKPRGSYLGPPLQLADAGGRRIGGVRGRHTKSRTHVHVQTL